MNSIEAFKKLEEIEELICNDKNYRSNYLWPVLKSWLWDYYLYKDEDKSKIEEIKKLFKKPVLALLNSFFNFLFYSIYKDKYKVEVLFFSRRILPKKLSNGNYFDRLIDPIVLLLNNSLVTKKFLIDKILPTNIYTTKNFIPKPGIKYTLYGYFKSKKNIEIEIFSKLVLNKLNINFKTNKKSIFQAFSKYYSWTKNGNKILSQFKNLKKVVLISWYHMDSMGLINAARNLNINTYDLQHGKQGKYQAMYSGWKSIKVIGSYINIPNYFLNWNDYSKSNILKACVDRKDHKPLLFFNPEIYWDYLTLPKEIPDTEANCIRLLYIAPIQEGEIVDVLPIENLLRLLSEFQGKVYIKIRFHPNSPKQLIKNNLNRVKKLNYYKKNIKIIISDPNELFLTELRWCTHILSYYSTCCIEANKFNKGVCILGNDAKEIFSELIDNLRFIWLKDLDYINKSIFSEWLEKEFPNKDKNEKFIFVNKEIKEKLKLLIKK